MGEEQAAWVGRELTKPPFTPEVLRAAGRIVVSLAADFMEKSGTMAECDSPLEAAEQLVRRCEAAGVAEPGAVASDPVSDLVHAALAEDGDLVPLKKLVVTLAGMLPDWSTSERTIRRALKEDGISVTSRGGRSFVPKAASVQAYFNYMRRTRARGSEAGESGV